MHAKEKVQPVGWIEQLVLKVVVESTLLPHSIRAKSSLLTSMQYKLGLPWAKRLKKKGSKKDYIIEEIIIPIDQIKETKLKINFK